MDNFQNWDSSYVLLLLNPRQTCISSDCLSYFLVFRTPGQVLGKYSRKQRIAISLRVQQNPT
jgi:hypothetical protein